MTTSEVLLLRCSKFPMSVHKRHTSTDMGKLSVLVSIGPMISPSSKGSAYGP